MRALLITIVAVATAVSAAAEPPKNRNVPVQPQPHSRVVLASAENMPVTPPQEAQRAGEPAKPIKPRITTCRCGDPQVDAATPEQ